MNDDNRIDIISLMLTELDRKIAFNDNPELHKIKLYMECHKPNCLDYLYESKKYKDKMISMTSIFRELYADLCREILEIIQDK